MRSPVCPALITASIVHSISADHDRRRGQRCTALTHPISLIHRGISVQLNRAASLSFREGPRSINVSAQRPNNLNGLNLGKINNQVLFPIVCRAINFR